MKTVAKVQSTLEDWVLDNQQENMDVNELGWRFSPDKALRVRVAALRRVGNRLLLNIMKETHKTHVPSILNHVDSQGLVVAEHRKAFDLVASLTIGFDEIVEEMMRLFDDWHNYLVKTCTALDELEPKSYAELDGQVTALASDLQKQTESSLEKLAEIHERLHSTPYQSDAGEDNVQRVSDTNLTSITDHNGVSDLGSIISRKSESYHSDRRGDAIKRSTDGDE